MPSAQHVFIISFDGGKPAVMQKSTMPTLFRLFREGAGTWDARTVVPSITLVSHTSMLTGAQPAQHTIDWNTWDPKKGMVPVPTIFSSAKAYAKAQKKEIVTGMFFGKEKFFHLVLPGSLDAASLPSYAAKIVAEHAALFIRDRKPNLCFIHFADSDGAGHKYGWGSPEQVKAFADEDAALKVVLNAIRRAGLEKKSTVILSADHGGHEKTHGKNIPEDMIIPWIAYGAGIRRGVTLTQPVLTCDTAATALMLLDIPLPPDIAGKPVLEALA
jgi:predicted AlkP superfamily pyrophosphatase or phosphodiesterase